MIFFGLWTCLAVLLGLLWIVRVFAVESALRVREFLHEGSFDGAPMQAPKISIVVAGKDEEKNIEACVVSLLDQDYPNFELIVVDDRSTDRTPAILNRLTSDYANRLHMMRVETLPPGWFGKHNAVRVGMEAATGDWLLFTDADCRQTSRKTLSLAMNEVLSRKTDFLSLLPNLERRALWERIVQPICATILMVWFRPARVNNPSLPTAYANGAFMLMSRTCYNAIGGHEAVRDKINEDMHMAALAKARGQRLRVMENKSLYEVRMYESFRAGFHGWSRIFYGCFERPSRIAAAFALTLVGGMFPYVSLVIAFLVALAGGDPAWWRAAAMWGGVVLLIQLVTARLYFALGYGLFWSLFYGIAVAVNSAMLLNALLKSFGLTRTTWRRTTYGSSLPARDSSVAV